MITAIPTQEKTPRRARFKRDQSVALALQERDKEIIRQVHKHRFLTSEHIGALVDSSQVRVLRRLHKLYHAGFLDRPKAQLLRLGNCKMVYALGNEGAALLSSEYDLPLPSVDWTTKNREAKGLFIEHTLMVSNLLVAVQLAVRKVKGVEYIESDNIVARRPVARQGSEKQLSWKVRVSDHGRDYSLSVVPDAAFGLRFTETGETAYFFVECDRSTMPIQRSNLNRSSFAKKLLGYYESWKQRVFRAEFNFEKPRVLTLTISEGRIKSMVEANRTLDSKGEGFGFFLFAPEQVINLDKAEELLGKVWTNVRGEKV